MKIIDTVTLLEGKWTGYMEKIYLDRAGQEKRWSYIGRNGDRRAVVVVPVTEKTGTLVLIRQYRLPLEKYVLEFPAGLIDDGESVEDAALRELMEETGYSGRVGHVSGPLCTSPGLTSELVVGVRVTCSEEPLRPPALEDSELLSVVRVPPGEFPRILDGMEDTVLDSKVLFFMQGMLSGS